MATGRIERVAQAIQEEVAQILQRELKDPRIGFVTITRVRVTADLQHATIYYSLLEGPSARAPGEASSPRGHGSAAETEAGLRSAQGFIRRLLGDRLRLRVSPEVIFRLDSTVEEDFRIARILGELKKDSEQGTVDSEQ